MMAIISGISEDLLDRVHFTCCKCNKRFKHTEGTWLPIGIEDSRFMEKLSEGFPQIFNFSMRPPEIVYDDKFTCYDCITYSPIQELNT